MTLTPDTYPRAVFFLLLLGLLNLWLAGRWLPAPAPVRAVASQQENWLLPELKPPDIAEARKVLSKLELWPTRAEGDQTEEPALALPLLKDDYRLAGIVGGESAYALFIDSEAKVVGYREGDMLPDGALLLDINPDSVRLSRERGAEERRLYAPPQSRQTEVESEQAAAEAKPATDKLPGLSLEELAAELGESDPSKLKLREIPPASSQ